jgi:hypothetical protein
MQSNCSQTKLTLLADNILYIVLSNETINTMLEERDVREVRIENERNTVKHLTSMFFTLVKLWIIRTNRYIAQETEMFWLACFTSLIKIHFWDLNIFRMFQNYFRLDCSALGLGICSSSDLDLYFVHVWYKDMFTGLYHTAYF